jgi:hypothetical protein
VGSVGFVPKDFGIARLNSSLSLVVTGWGGVHDGGFVLFLLGSVSFWFGQGGGVR